MNILHDVDALSFDVYMEFPSCHDLGTTLVWRWEFSGFVSWHIVCLDSCEVIVPILRMSSSGEFAYFNCNKLVYSNRGD